jgi:rhomboid family GlyGly-CTERM serine protease
MHIKQLPCISIGLTLACVGLFYGFPDNQTLLFSAELIARGEWWRAVTGHFIHIDTEHLVWNCLGLLVVGTMLEHRSRKTFCAAMTAGVIAVNALLLSPYPDLDYYCGLSGVLNTLLLVALWLEWRQRHSVMIICIGVACVAKALIETLLGISLFTSVGWEPYAMSHLAGLAGGLCLIVLANRPAFHHCQQEKQSAECG